MSCNLCCKKVNYHENISITPCGHIFCFVCIYKYIFYNKTCPTCNKILLKELDLTKDKINDEHIPSPPKELFGCVSPFPKK